MLLSSLCARHNGGAVAHMVMNTALHLLTDFMSWSYQQRERSPQIPSSITCRAWGEKTKKQNNKQGAQQVKVSLPYLTTACFLLLPLLSSLAQHHTLLRNQHKSHLFLHEIPADKLTLLAHNLQGRLFHVMA